MAAPDSASQVEIIQSKVRTSPDQQHDDSYHRSLLEQIAHGSEKALTEFYEAFQQKIYAFAKIRLNDSHDAADLLNEVMWEVWRGAHRFEGRSSVTTWAFGIANYKIIDRLRSRGKVIMEELESTVAEESDQDLDDMMTQKQLGEHLRRCMEKLSDEQRQVVHLAFFEDLSYREISEIVGNPEGTIKARMLHAKQALKRCLARRIK